MSIFKRILGRQEKSEDEVKESSINSAHIKVRIEKYNSEEFEKVDYLNLLENKLLT